MELWPKHNHNILNVSLWDFIKASVQNGVSVFELEAHEDSEVYTTQIYQGRFTTAARLAEFV